MSLLYDNEGDARLVVALQFDASFTDGCQLVSQNLRKCTLISNL